MPLIFLQNVKNPSLRGLFDDEDSLSEDKIDCMLVQFLADVKIGSWKQKGWPKVWTAHSVSKSAVNAYSRLLAKRNKG